MKKFCYVLFLHILRRHYDFYTPCTMNENFDRESFSAGNATTGDVFRRRGGIAVTTMVRDPATPRYAGNNRMYPQTNSGINKSDNPYEGD